MAEVFGFKKMKNFDEFEYLIDKFLEKYQLHIRRLLERSGGEE
jgi:hypothetical protein